MELKHIGSNQTELTIRDRNDVPWLVLFSYNTPVAAENLQTGSCYRTKEKWSATTSKHINRWLGRRKAESTYQEFFNTLVL